MFNLLVGVFAVLVSLFHFKLYKQYQRKENLAVAFIIFSAGVLNLAIALVAFL